MAATTDDAPAAVPQHTAQEEADAVYANEDYDWDDNDDDDDDYDDACYDAGVRAGVAKLDVHSRFESFSQSVHSALEGDASGPLRTQLPSSVLTTLKVHGHSSNARQPNRKDKSDRATVEQAIDPRTRMVLFKMLNRGVYSDLQGCVSTGKEANVYQATRPDGGELAIKVYKTSILVFKDRDRYVSGDTRFSSRYSKGNPRKMVRTWAEKEMRNLHRLAAAGVRCPLPVELRSHVLVMDFIGEGGVAAPRLKDAGLPLAHLRTMYRELLRIVWVLYHKCRLVHADLSEYNILVHKGELYIIDVSQSVELDHPLALDFLREDCSHVNDFFRRSGVATVTMREFFDFVVDPAVREDNVEEVLDALSTVASSRPLGRTAEESMSDALLRGAYIPRKLEEVAHYERDHDRLAGGPNGGPAAAAAAGARTLRGEGGTGGGVGGVGGGGAEVGGGRAAGGAAVDDEEMTFFQTLAGMKADMSGPRSRPMVLERIEAAAAASAAAASAAAAADVASAAGDVAAAAEGGAGAGAPPGPSVAVEAAGAPGSGGTAGGEQQAQQQQQQQQAQGPGPAAGAASGSCGGGEGAVAQGRGGGGGELSGSEGDSDDDSEDSEGEGWEERGGGGGGPEDREAAKAARKDHKKAVKEANRERRKAKMPKHVKKAAQKRNAARKAKK